MSMRAEKPDPFGGGMGTTVLECLRILMTGFALPLADPAIDAPFPFAYDSEKGIVRLAMPFPFKVSQRQWLSSLEMLIGAPSLPTAASILWDYRQSLDPENGLSWIIQLWRMISDRADPARSTPQSRWAVLLSPHVVAAEYFAQGLTGDPDALIDLRIFLHEDETLAWLTRTEAPELRI